jgi:hypothetical protein
MRKRCIYFAGKAKWWSWVAGAAGMPISGTWDADVLLLYYQSTEKQFGSLLECGAALGAGKWVYLVTDIALPFLSNHPKVRTFTSLANAIAALMGTAAPQSV